MLCERWYICITKQKTYSLIVGLLQALVDILTACLVVYFSYNTGNNALTATHMYNF